MTFVVTKRVIPAGEPLRFEVISRQGITRTLEYTVDLARNSLYYGDTPTDHSDLRGELVESIMDEDFSLVCANPVCGAMAKDGVKLKYCRGSMGAHYCSDSCQRKDRAEHKKHCRDVKDINVEIKATS